MLVLAGLPCVLLWRQHIRLQTPTRQALSNVAALLATCALLVLVLVLFFQSIASVMRNNTQLRYLINPLNSFYALGSIAARPFQRDESAILPLGTDAKLGASYTAQARPPLLLLVLGETGRSGNFAVNGYGRPTTPGLAKENIASQRNAWSCGTSTAASVPCMFSNFGRANYESRPANYEGLMDVLQHAGPGRALAGQPVGLQGRLRPHSHMSTPAQLKVPGLCDGGECFDEVMLHGLDERIAALPAERRAKGVVVVMHQMGSHGPAYFKRSPAAFKKFLPECTNNALQSCDAARAGQCLRQQHRVHRPLAGIEHPVAQDAGTAQRRPPCSTWPTTANRWAKTTCICTACPTASRPTCKSACPGSPGCRPDSSSAARSPRPACKQQLDAPISHDNYFHSVLGLMNVQTSVYQPALDIYAHCQTGVPPGQP